jgi:hypothetical protein
VSESEGISEGDEGINEGVSEGESESVSKGVSKSKDEIIFVFYESSPSKPAPGKGSGEKIPPHLRVKYTELNAIDNWRRMLDDSWTKGDQKEKGDQNEGKGLFKLDGKYWSSVALYMLGAQFKNGFPDVYHAFSLDSGSDISKDYQLAKKAISQKTGTVLVQGEKKKAKADA